jgi:hypothetical protein
VDITKRARQRGYDLDPIDLALALQSETLPTWQTVTGLLTACGLGGMQIDRWMRVYHDLSAPAQPVAAAAPPPAEEPVDAEPVSVPPLILSTAPAEPARLGRKHFAIAAGVLAALILVPLLAFALFGGEPDTVTADATSSPSFFSDAVPPPLPADSPAAEPSPAEPAVPTTPGPVTTTAKPPARTTAPPPLPAPSPNPIPPVDPTVLRSGVEALEGHEAVDLDSGEGARDIFRGDEDSLVAINGSQLRAVSGIPSKQSCQAVQGWQGAVGHLDPGEWLCVRTSAGHYGRINITAIGSSLKLAYLVWRSGRPGHCSPGLPRNAT